MVRELNRRDLLRAAGVGGAASLAGCTDWLPFGTDVVWPSIRYDPGNTGHAPELTGPSDPDERWEVETDDQQASVAALDGNRAFGGIASDSSADLVAHEREDGDEAWDENVGGSTAPYPVLAGDTVLASGDDEIVAYDAGSGDERWEEDLGGEWANVQTAVDGTAIAMGDEGDEVTLAALDVDDGSEQWDESFDGRSLGTAVEGDTVYAVVERTDGTVEVLSLSLDDGDEQWQERLTGDRLWGVPATDGERLYVSIRGTGEVVALDADDGDEEWRTSGAFTPAVTDDWVLTSEGDAVVALDPDDGDEEWRTSFDDGTVLWPVVGSERIYVGSLDPAAVYALDMDGDEEWRHEIDAYWALSPIVADGVAYIGTYDPGLLIALEED